MNTFQFSVSTCSGIPVLLQQPGEHRADRAGGRPRHQPHAQRVPQAVIDRRHGLRAGEVVDVHVTPRLLGICSGNDLFKTAGLGRRRPQEARQQAVGHQPRHHTGSRHCAFLAAAARYGRILRAGRQRPGPRGEINGCMV